MVMVLSMLILEYWRIEAAEEGEGERPRKRVNHCLRLCAALKSVPRLVGGRCSGMVSLPSYGFLHRQEILQMSLFAQLQLFNSTT